MDGAVASLLAELDALGIAVKAQLGEVSVRPKPPPELLDRLRRHKDALARAIRVRDARTRQARAVERLAADRRTWIEENKRLGYYRGPE
jgi:hypothetical protein